MSRGGRGGKEEGKGGDSSSVISSTDQDANGERAGGRPGEAGTPIVFLNVTSLTFPLTDVYFLDLKDLISVQNL